MLAVPLHESHHKISAIDKCELIDDIACKMNLLKINFVYLISFRFEQMVQQMPGLSHLCESLWYMFPKERYSYKNASAERRDSNCTDASNCSTNGCANGKGTSTSDCSSRHKDHHNFMDYDDFNGVVDANDHDHNDSMEDDLFAAVIRHSAANEGSDAAHTDTDETH